MAEKDYYVYRYQYREMKEPKWDAKPISGGIDMLPPTVHSKPGILNISARNKEDAIEQGKGILDSELIDNDPVAAIYLFENPGEFNQSKYEEWKAKKGCGWGGCMDKATHKAFTKLGDFDVCSVHAKEAEGKSQVRYIVPFEGTE